MVIHAPNEGKPPNLNTWDGLITLPWHAGVSMRRRCPTLRVKEIIIVGLGDLVNSISLRRKQIS